jgi:hypothetical protein
MRSAGKIFFPSDTIYLREYKKGDEMFQSEKKRKSRAEEELKREIASIEEKLRSSQEEKKFSGIEIGKKERLLEARKREYAELLNSYLAKDEAESVVLEGELVSLQNTIDSLERRLAFDRKFELEQDENIQAYAVELDRQKRELTRMHAEMEKGYGQRLTEIYKGVGREQEDSESSLDAINAAKATTNDMLGNRSGAVSDKVIALRKQKELIQNAAAAGASKEELEQLKKKLLKGSKDQ